MEEKRSVRYVHGLVDGNEDYIEEEYDDDEHDKSANDGNEGSEANEQVLSGGEIVMDYTSVFMNMDYFSSCDALKDWVRQVGMQHNMVITVKRSDSGGGKKKARVYMACERAGLYRKPKPKVEPKKDKEKDVDDSNIEEKVVTNAKATGTKKCECPFLLKGTQNTPFEWSLEVKCGTHNHPIAKYKEGHSYAGRLTTDEEMFVVDMSKCHAPPKAILKELKRKNADNVATLRTIYNARNKHKINQYCGRSQLQYLMSQFVENKYFHSSRRCEKTNSLIELFFSHPVSIKLVRAFPNVLLIDCTYKTNRYRLPYLEIVGVTSTGITFSVASVYLMGEKEENYTWALGVLRDMLGEAALPSVIVTDRELALMNAVAYRFPESKHFLCTWHIERNVLAKCKGDFKDEDKWKAFMRQFNYIMFAENEIEFQEAVDVLHSKFVKKPVNYVMKQWINPYKERFVKAWTNKVMHYGNTTTNRVESHHSALKRMLGNSLGNFETCWVKCDALYEACHAHIKASFEKSVNVAMHKLA